MNSTERSKSKSQMERMEDKMTENEVAKPLMMLLENLTTKAVTRPPIAWREMTDQTMGE